MIPLNTPFGTHVFEPVISNQTVHRVDELIVKGYEVTSYCGEWIICLDLLTKQIVKRRAKGLYCTKEQAEKGVE